MTTTNRYKQARSNLCGFVTLVKSNKPYIYHAVLGVS